MVMPSPAQMMGMQAPFMSQNNNNNIPQNKLFVGEIPRAMTQVDIF